MLRPPEQLSLTVPAAVNCIQATKDSPERSPPRHLMLRTIMTKQRIPKTESHDPSNNADSLL